MPGPASTYSIDFYIFLKIEQSKPAIHPFIFYAPVNFINNDLYSLHDTFGRPISNPPRAIRNCHLGAVAATRGWTHGRLPSQMNQRKTNLDCDRSEFRFGKNSSAN